MENKISQFELRSAKYRDRMARRHAADSEAAKETGTVHGTWQFENLMLSYIRDGETEKLRTFLADEASRTEFREGTLASDPLRQAKNLLIGLTALVGKVAGIGGGMDVEDAYRLIDLYTQECEKAADVVLIQPTLECDATPESPAGEYEIRVFGAEAQNYEFTYVPGILTVLPAEDAVRDLSALHAQPSTIHDLSGREVVNSNSAARKLNRGVYIIGGKKVVK